MVKTKKYNTRNNPIRDRRRDEERRERELLQAVISHSTPLVPNSGGQPRRIDSGQALTWDHMRVGSNELSPSNNLTGVNPVNVDAPVFGGSVNISERDLLNNSSNSVEDNTINDQQVFQGLGIDLLTGQDEHLTGQLDITYGFNNLNVERNVDELTGSERDFVNSVTQASGVLSNAAGQGSNRQSRYEAAREELNSLQRSYVFGSPAEDQAASINFQTSRPVASTTQVPGFNEVSDAAKPFTPNLDQKVVNSTSYTIEGSTFPSMINPSNTANEGSILGDWSQASGDSAGFESGGMLGARPKVSKKNKSRFVYGVDKKYYDLAKNLSELSVAGGTGSNQQSVFGINDHTQGEQAGRPGGASSGYGLNSMSAANQQSASNGAGLNSSGPGFNPQSASGGPGCNTQSALSGSGFNSTMSAAKQQYA